MTSPVFTKGYYNPDIKEKLLVYIYTKRDKAMTNNEKIARFMGGTKKIDTWRFNEHPAAYINDGTGMFVHEEDLNYDKRWDWLMPVVEKINDGKITNEAYGSVHFWHSCTGFQSDWKCSILGSLTYQIPVNETQHTYKTINIPHITEYSKDSMSCVYKAVIQFIDWYEEQPKP